MGDLIYLYTEKQDSDEWILKNDLYFNGKEIVTGKNGYEKWWSREYKRRVEDDIS
ncbi:hypothetical protein [Anaerobutyricum hallii]|uniref:hypothetical protein n=1 Tax=Lachnospiraceae TaxID=186803 RepID=UPI00242E3515|nr:hypothetical protein [Anaerobutyricum hallii]MDD6588513.1 hypothetical protein [Anaerobutyricum hallii]